MTTLIINQKTINTFSKITPLLDPELMLEKDMEEMTVDLYNKINEVIVPTNVFGTEEGYELRLLAPGLKKENIKVDIDDANVLTISASVDKEVEEENLDCYRVEFGLVGFSRSFLLPDDALTEEIITEYKNGIIKVWLPKVIEGFINWV